MKATKRILSVLLAVLLAMSAVVTAAAYGAEDGYKPEYQRGKDYKPDPTYKELIYAAMGWPTTFDEPEDDMHVYNFICGYNADGTTPIEGAIPDYIVCFAAFEVVSPSTCGEYIGNYFVGSYSIHGPYELGYHVYSTADAEIYTLREAWDADLPNMDYVLNMLGAKKYQYRDVFEEYIKSLPSYRPEMIEYMRYDELYSYYAEDVTADEATPDYVLVYGYGDMTPSSAFGIFGDYIVTEGYSSPYALPYYVIVPEENCKVYTLREAWDAQLEGIENIFTDYKLGKLIGDADSDGKLTVRDATYIQKCLAGLIEFSAEDATYAFPEDGGWPRYYYISDFNGDDERNIKDATAIQKEVAGIEIDYPDNRYESEKIPFSSTIHKNIDYADDCILVVIKYGWGHSYTLEDFPEYEFSSIDKIGGTDGKGYAIYALYLKNPGKENVFEAIRSLDYRADTDLEAAQPDYIYYVDEWI